MPVLCLPSLVLPYHRIGDKQRVHDDKHVRRPAQVAFWDNPSEGYYSKRNQAGSAQPVQRMINQPAFPSQPLLTPESWIQPGLNSTNFQSQARQHTPFNHFAPADISNLYPVSPSIPIPAEAFGIPAFVKAITVRQDEDLPPRFRRKIKDFSAGSKVSDSKQLGPVPKSIQSSNVQYRPNQRMPALHSNQKGRYNEQQFCQTNSFVKKPRQRPPLFNSSADSDQLRQRQTRPWRQRINQRPDQIPLSAYVAATNMLRDDRFVGPELTSDCCCLQKQNDVFSAYRLDEDDVSLFGSESPLRPELGSEISYASPSSEEKSDGSSVFGGILDDETIDETLDELEKLLTDGDVLTIDDLLTERENGKGYKQAAKVYKTKDFMQWARMYFDSQLRKKIDPKILDWASQESTASSPTKPNSIGETVFDLDVKSVESEKSTASDAGECKHSDAKDETVPNPTAAN